MSEEIFKILLEEFKRNGVKLIEHDFRCDVFISDPADIIHETSERQFTTIPRLLDFSEHDKIFEDKIAKLEKQIESYEAERKELRTRCCMDSAREKFDNHSYGGLVIYTKNFTSECERRLYDENESLKQRIAELESKETEKPRNNHIVIVAENINGQTYVTLDDFMSVVNDLQAQIGT